jgi:hypothetical protein
LHEGGKHDDEKGNARLHFGCGSVLVFLRMSEPVKRLIDSTPKILFFMLLRLGLSFVGHFDFLSFVGSQAATKTAWEKEERTLAAQRHVKFETSRLVTRTLVTHSRCIQIQRLFLHHTMRGAVSELGSAALMATR